MNIGLFIAKERTKRNLSRPQLAKMVDCSSRAIEYWESGERNISLENLDKILKSFHMAIKIGYGSELLEGCERS